MPRDAFQFELPRSRPQTVLSPRSARPQTSHNATLPPNFAFHALKPHRIPSPRSPRRPGTAAYTFADGEYKPAPFLQQLKVSPRLPKPNSTPRPSLLLPIKPGPAPAAAPATDEPEAGAPASAAVPSKPPNPPAAEPLEDKPPLVLVDDSPGWLLFPTVPRDGESEPPVKNEVYKPKQIAFAFDKTEYEEVYDVLRRTRLFRSITDKDLGAIVGLGRVFEYPRYSILVREGTNSTTCYVVLSGSLSYVSLRHPATNTILKPADTFGETGLVSDLVRDHTVHALSSCRVFQLERAVLDPPLKKDAWKTPEVTAYLKATPEWTELKHLVIADILENLPFFSALVSSRRAALAALMTIVQYEKEQVIFREGDQALNFYIVSDGHVEIHKSGSSKFGSSRVVNSITPNMDRPWFGEVALFLRKPRAGSALVVSETVRLLVVDEIHFDAFLAMVPDFRPYLNKNHNQASVLKQKKNLMELQAAEQETAELQAKQNVAAQWQSGGRLGGTENGPEEDGQRSIFAERWERMVTSLLYLPGANGQMNSSRGARHHSTVSFKTKDYMYVPSPPKSARRAQ